jgi:hypothetical protein
MIDQMVNFMLLCDRKNLMEECEKTKITIEKAKDYKRKLEILIDANMDVTDQKKIIFLQEFEIDKDDPLLKQKFFEIKSKMIEKINKFYDNGRSQNKQTPSTHNNDYSNIVPKKQFSPKKLTLDNKVRKQENNSVVINNTENTEGIDYKNIIFYFLAFVLANIVLQKLYN